MEIVKKQTSGDRLYRIFIYLVLSLLAMALIFTMAPQTVLAEGDAIGREDIITLQDLPLLDGEGEPK